MHPDTIFHVPVLLRWLCYLGGMSLFVSTIFWLLRLSLGKVNIFTLRQISVVWFARILAFCAAGSFIYMTATGDFLNQPARALPEMAILLLLAAFYIAAAKKHVSNPVKLFTHGLPLEIFKTGGVVAVCILGWVLAAFIGRSVLQATMLAGAPLWVPIFITGLLMNAPILVLYIRIREEERNFKFYHLLWPVVLAYLLVMLPDILEYLGNSHKVEEIMHARGRLQRA